MCAAREARYVASFGVLGVKGNRSYVFPRFVAVCRNGNIFVSASGELHMFTPDFKHVCKIEMQPLLTACRGIDVNTATNELFVVGQDGILVYSQNGNFVRMAVEAGDARTFDALCVQPRVDGKLWVCKNQNETIQFDAAAGGRRSMVASGHGAVEMHWLTSPLRKNGLQRQTPNATHLAEHDDKWNLYITCKATAIDPWGNIISAVAGGLECHTTEGELVWTAEWHSLLDTNTVKGRETKTVSMAHDGGHRLFVCLSVMPPEKRVCVLDV